MATPEHHTFTTTLDCNYLLLAPDAVEDRTLLVLATHGYGSNPEVMLRLTARMVGAGHLIASLQAPNQHNLAPNTLGSEVGFNWGTRVHPAASIALHHRMLLQVLAHLRSRFSLAARRTLLVGFSQSVGLNYRFAGTHPDQLRGVIAICGGVPKNWETGPFQPVTASILHIARNEDEFYPAAIAQGFPDRLRAHAADVEFHLLPGKHRFPSQANALVAGWIGRKFL